MCTVLGHMWQVCGRCGWQLWTLEKEHGERAEAQAWPLSLFVLFCVSSHCGGLHGFSPQGQVTEMTEKRRARPQPGPRKAE